VAGISANKLGRTPALTLSCTRSLTRYSRLTFFVRSYPTFNVRVCSRLLAIILAMNLPFSTTHLLILIHRFDIQIGSCTIYNLRMMDSQEGHNSCCAHSLFLPLSHQQHHLAHDHCNKNSYMREIWWREWHRNENSIVLSFKLARRARWLIYARCLIATPTSMLATPSETLLFMMRR